MLFDTLVDYDDGTAIVPKLAASWTVSADGRRWRFQLRPDVRFSTGRAVDRGRREATRSSGRCARALHSPGAEFFSGIDGAEAYVAGRAAAVSGHPHARRPTSWRSSWRTPTRCSSTSWRCPSRRWSTARRPSADGDEAFVRHPVGTGPFRLVEWTYGQRIRLERNPYYWRDGPAVSRRHRRDDRGQRSARLVQVPARRRWTSRASPRRSSRA